MNFMSTNLKIKDMIVNREILENIDVYNDLKVPILVYINNTVDLIKPNKIITKVNFNKLTIIKFRLPKITQKKKTDFTNGKDFKIELNIEYVNNHFSFNKYILSNEEIKAFFDSNISFN